MSKKEETTLNIADIARHIEAMVFTADQAVSIREIEQTLKLNITEDITKDQIKEAIAFLIERYASDDFAIAFVEISKGFRFMSKSEYHRTISSHLNIKAKKRLSKAAMETLSIIAYKQPISKSQIEEIRGVNSDYGVQKLLEKELIAIVGRGDSVGRPLLYGPSQQFMDHFGLKSVKDLPKLKEVIPQHNQIGDNATEEEVKTEEESKVEAIAIESETEETIESETEEAIESETEETIENEGAETIENEGAEETIESETEEAIESETEEAIKSETEETIESETEEIINLDSAWETKEVVEWESEDERDDLAAEVEADLAEVEAQNEVINNEQIKDNETTEETISEATPIEVTTEEKKSESIESKENIEEEKSIGKTSEIIE